MRNKPGEVSRADFGPPSAAGPVVRAAPCRQAASDPGVSSFTPELCLFAGFPCSLTASRRRFWIAWTPQAPQSSPSPSANASLSQLACLGVAYAPQLWWAPPCPGRFFYHVFHFLVLFTFTWLLSSPVPWSPPLTIFFPWILATCILWAFLLFPSVFLLGPLPFWICWVLELALMLSSLFPSLSLIPESFPSLSRLQLLSACWQVLKIS